MSVYDQYPRSTWLDVDLGLLKRNITIIQDTAKVPVLVVLKANAYGHGAVECAKVAEECGAEVIGVATVAEGALIQDKGVKTPILRITGYGMDEIAPMVERGMHFIAWFEDQINAAEKAARDLGKTALLHLKIDTGMGRSGVFPEKAGEIAAKIQASNHLELVAVMSHFHSADSDDISSAEDQIAKFNQAVELVEQAGITPRYCHLSNSPGLLRFPHARYNMVRSGIVTYGHDYERGFDLPDGMAPISEWKARVVAIKILPPGHVVSYGGKYVTEKAEKIAILPVGYADGFHRYPDAVNEVLLHGRRVPVVGRVCMDQCMIRIPDDIDAEIGDEAVLMGRQGGDEITSLDIADRWGTNNYDVIANISPRVPRRYHQ